MHSVCHSICANTTLHVRLNNAHAEDGIRFVVDGKVLREKIVGASGELSWQLAPGQTKWCSVELRDAEGGLWAMTNPIFFE